MKPGSLELLNRKPPLQNRRFKWGEHVTALGYTPEDLTNNLHSYLLPESDSVIWRLNYKQMGLGGDNSWGARPLDKYQIPANQTYKYTFTLKPISTSDVDASMAESKVVLP